MGVFFALLEVDTETVLVTDSAFLASKCQGGFHPTLPYPGSAPERVVEGHLARVTWRWSWETGCIRSLALGHGEDYYFSCACQYTLVNIIKQELAAKPSQMFYDSYHMCLVVL